MTTTLSCPRCGGQSLLEQTRGTATLHGCNLCGGVWIGNELGGRILRERVPDALALADSISASAGPPLPVSHVATCPSCSTPLRTVGVEGIDIEIDLCDAHGTWFDRDELSRLSFFLEMRRRAAEEFPQPMHFNPANYQDYLIEGHWKRAPKHYKRPKKPF